MYTSWFTKNTFNDIDGIKVNKSYIKCLGVYIGHDKNECYNKNCMKVYDNMEKLFESLPFSLGKKENLQFLENAV